MKPILVADGIDNKFIERDRSVSISIDKPKLFIDSSFKAYIQIEPDTISGMTGWIIDNHQKFDLILAWDERILTKCPNSRLFIYGTSWLDYEKSNMSFGPFRFENIDVPSISFLTSSKAHTLGHKFRLGIHQALKRIFNDELKILNLKTPPRIDSKDIVFIDSMFSIVVENERQNNWITEKLIDCFVAKTIPIYWGAPNVGEFFDLDGIIPFSNYSELESIVRSLRRDDYEKLLFEIERNHHKASEYIDFWKRADGEISKCHST